MNLKELFEKFPQKPTRDLFTNYLIYSSLGKTTTKQNKKWFATSQEMTLEIATANLPFAEKIQFSIRSGRRWPVEIENSLLSLYGFLINDGFSQHAAMTLIYDQVRIPEDETAENFRRTVSAHLNAKRKNESKTKPVPVKYNVQHREPKDNFTKSILANYRPIRSILDLFSGELSFYKDPQRNGGLVNTRFVFTNDIEHGGIDAADLIKECIEADMSFDLVDVDCFGDPGRYGPIENLLKITRKILILTFGNCPRVEHWASLQQNWKWEELGLPAQRGEDEAYRDRILNSMPLLGKKIGKEVSCIGSFTWKGNMGFRLAFLVK